MSESKDKPEYMAGDICEIYVPHLKEHRWIEVESVEVIKGVQHLQPRGSNLYFCECLVRVQSFAFPHQPKRF